MPETTTTPPELWFALCTEEVRDTDTGSTIVECAQPGYTRLRIPASGEVEIAPELRDTWDWWCICDAPTGGNMIWYNERPPDLGNGLSVYVSSDVRAIIDWTYRGGEPPECVHPY